MKRLWKRWACALLTAVLLLAALPAPAYAAVGELVRNTMLENSALLAALREAYGEDAETYLALLESYGLVDSRGNLITDEKITVDGVDYTLEELEEYLSDPEVDLSTVAEVDGTYVTLENLKLVLEIERYLAYVQATYFTEQEVTDEQKNSFYALARAWANGELDIAGGAQPLAVNTLTEEGPSGIDYGVRLEVTAADTASANGPYTVTVRPTEAQSQEITFSWRAVSGSMDVTGGGTVTIPANSTESMDLTVEVGDGAGRINGEGTFVVQLYDLTNALFDNDSDRWETAVTVAKQDAIKYRTTIRESIESTEELYYVEGNFLRQSADNMNPIGNIEAKNKYDGLSEYVAGTSTISLPSDLEGSAFQGTVRVTPTFTRADPQGLHFLDMGYQTFDELSIWGDFRNGDTTGDWWTYDGIYKISDATLNYGVKTGENGSVLQPATKEVDFYDRDSYTMDELKTGTFAVPAGAPVQVDVYAFPMRTKVGVKGGSETIMHYVPKASGTATLEVWDTTNALEARISAPAGTYYPGQKVPITVSFYTESGDPYPVAVSSRMVLVINGKELTPEERSTTADCLTFLYTVQETDNTGLYLEASSFIDDLDGTTSGDAVSSSQVTGANEMPINVTVDHSYLETETGESGGTQIPGVKLETPDREDAFTAFTLTMGADAANKPQLTVTATLNPAGGDYTLWVLNELADNYTEETGYILTSLAVSVDGGKTSYHFKADSGAPTALTATIPLDYNTGTSAVTGQVEFWLDGALLFGEALEYSVDPAMGVTVDAMAPTLTVTPAGEDSGTSYGPEDTVPLLYAQQDNMLALSFALTGSGYTWGTPSKVSYIQADGTVADPTAHFAWKSSNSDAASFRVEEATGNVALVPTGQAGTTGITLVALNGGLDRENEDGSTTIVGLQDAETEPITVTFAVGQDPFLMIPTSGSSITIRQGNNAVVNWSSNLCQKNETGGENGAFVPTTFHVAAFYTPTEGEPAEPVAIELPADIATLSTGTGEGQQRTISSVTIPWSVLEPIYNGGVRSFTVTVSAQYGDQWYGTYDHTATGGGSAKNATAQVTMVSRPTSVELFAPQRGGGRPVPDRQRHRQGADAAVERHRLGDHRRQRRRL